MKSFPSKWKDKAPADMHKSWALWLPSFKHYNVIIGWIPAWPASCHSYSHTFIFCIWVVLVELLECYYFSPHCKSGLDFAWHCALAGLRHGLNESKYKMQTKAISNIWSSRLWQIQGKLCTIPDSEMLANHVQKIRFNAACWGNHPCCVTCGCHFNASSYFVLWFPHLPHVKQMLALIKQAPVSAVHCVFNPFVALKGLRSMFRLTFSDKTSFYANRKLASSLGYIQEIWKS